MHGNEAYNGQENSKPQDYKKGVCMCESFTGTIITESTSALIAAHALGQVLKSWVCTLEVGCMFGIWHLGRNLFPKL